MFILRGGAWPCLLRVGSGRHVLSSCLNILLFRVDNAVHYYRGLQFTLASAGGEQEIPTKRDHTNGSDN